MDDVEALFRPKALLPYMKRLPAKRAVTLFNVSNTDALEFQIKFNTTEHPLPPGAANDVYATYTISGLDESVNKLGSGGKIAVHFVIDLSGLASVDRAEYIVEVIEAEPPAGPALSRNIHCKCIWQMHLWPHQREKSSQMKTQQLR